MQVLPRAVQVQAWCPNASCPQKEVVEGKNSYRKKSATGSGRQVVHIERLRFADNEPVSLEHMFFSL
ncbi:MAG: UTRA domain-containing protein [Coprococcus phoceensis]